MALTTDLMGLGEAHMLSRLYAFPPVLATAYGATLASANQIGGAQYFTVATSGTSALKLPQVNADTGCLLGDRFVIGNTTSASIVVYAASNAAGSVVVLINPAGSTSGATGVSVGIGSLVEFIPITVSAWMVSYGSA